MYWEEVLRNTLTVSIELLLLLTSLRVAAHIWLSSPWTGFRSQILSLKWQCNQSEDRIADDKELKTEHGAINASLSASRVLKESFGFREKKESLDI